MKAACRTIGKNLCNPAHMDVTGNAYTSFLSGYIFSVRHTRQDGPTLRRERSSQSNAFTSFAS